MVYDHVSLAAASPDEARGSRGRCILGRYGADAHQEADGDRAARDE
jgi:hypothetical protein